MPNARIGTNFKTEVAISQYHYANTWRAHARQHVTPEQIQLMQERLKELKRFKS